MGALKSELEDLIGADGLRRLIEHAGGRRAYIPKRPRDMHWLTLIVGREAADRLAWRYGGCRIEVPRPSPSGERDERMRRLRAQGWSVADIAADAGVSLRWAHCILRRAKIDRIG